MACFVFAACLAACVADPPGGGDPGPGGGKGDDPTSAQPVEICAGVTADRSGGAPASAAIQACLDATASGGELALPSGVYRITSLVRVGHGVTLHTRDVPATAPACLVEGAPPCASLRADDNLDVTRGFVQLEDSDVTVEHVVLDGNRAARLHSEGARQCAAGNNGAGFNGIATACTRCTFLMSATINALCGTGFEWNGADAFIGGNLVRDNGDHVSHNMWADGITVIFTEHAQVVSNYFVDNSDVDLILGSNRGGVVQHNTIHHGRQDSFAGLMLDNFNGAEPGDFVDAQVIDNTVTCNGRCDYGIQVGPHPWYPSANLRGGTIAANVVAGARMGLDVDGAGTPDAPTIVTGNQVGASPSSAAFLCGTRPSSRFNVAPDAVIDLGAGPAPDTAMLVHDCP